MMKKIILSILIWVFALNNISANEVNIVELKEWDIIKKIENHCERDLEPYILWNNNILTEEDRELYNLDNWKTFTKINLVLSKFNNKLSLLSEYKKINIFNKIIKNINNLNEDKFSNKTNLIFNILRDKIEMNVENIIERQKCKPNIIEFWAWVKVIRKWFTYKLMYNSSIIDKWYLDYTNFENKNKNIILINKYIEGTITLSKWFIIFNKKNWNYYKTNRLNIRNIKLWKNGIYFTEHWENWYSNLIMIDNNKNEKVLYKGKPDSWDNTIIIENYELLVNKQIKVFYEKWYKLKKEITIDIE